MLYYLFEWLHKLNFPGAGMFGYTSFRALMAIILALLISSIWGDKFINLLKRKQITETQRDASIDPFGVNKVGEYPAWAVSSLFLPYSFLAYYWAN